MGVKNKHTNSTKCLISRLVLQRRAFFLYIGIYLYTYISVNAFSSNKKLYADNRLETEHRWYIPGLSTIDISRAGESTTSRNHALIQ